MGEGRVCSRCQTVTDGDFCSNCGARLTPEDEVRQPLPKPSGSLKPKIIAIASFALILCLLAGTIFYLTRGFKNIELLPAIITSVCNNGISGRLNPDPIPVSGTPAVDVKPIPEVRITAPANALDRPRTFTVKKLSEKETEKYANLVYAQGAIPLYGFDIDADMEAGEVLPGKIGITLDLSALNIPKEAWNDIGLVRLDPSGNLIELKTVRSGNYITCYEQHNGVFMAVLVGFALGLPVAVSMEQSDKFKGEEWHSYSSENFRVFWPKSMPPQNPKEVERVSKELEKIWNDLYSDYLKKKSRVVKDKTLYTSPFEDMSDAADKLDLWVSFENDPRTKELKSLVSSDKWLRENFIPVQVVSGLDILERAYRYLTGTESEQRGFKGATFKIDVFFCQKWPYGPDILAMSVANRYIYPYIDLNLAEIPQKPLDASGSFDDLYTTVAHELFHCLQSRYFSPSQEYLWFEEATAVTLEGEAASYFQDRGWVKTVRRTDRAHLYDAYLRPMDFKNAEPYLLRQHGYGQSYFMEYLRDKYYTGGQKNKFLPRLLDTFSGWRAGTIDSLYKTTGGDPGKLGQDFVAFCTASRLNILNAYLPKSTVVTLDTSRPIFKWDCRPAPLSCEFRQLVIPDARPAGMPDTFRGIDTRPVAVIKGVQETDLFKSYYAHSVHDKAWTKIGPNGIFMILKNKIKNKNCYEIWLERIHAYAADPGKISYKNIVFVMHTPPAISAEKPKKGRIMLRWAQSPLKRNGLIGSYRVLVWAPNAKDDKPFVIDTDKNEAELVLKDILGKYKAKKGDCLEVVYRERLMSKTPVFGPPSQVLKVNIPVDDFGGTWKGKIAITSAPIQDKMIKWTVDFLHFLLQKWLTRDDIAGAIKPSKVIGASTELVMNIQPLDDSYENYQIKLRTLGATDWEPWEASCFGKAENGVLQFALKHRDGSTVHFKCYLQGEKTLKGDWSIKAFGMADAIAGNLYATQIAPAPAPSSSGQTGP